MIKKLVFILLRLTAIPFFIREIIQTKRVTIILYHDIKPDKADRHFRILRSKYNIISLKQYVKARKLGKADQLPPKSLIITFDDGHKGNYNLRPILEKHDIPAVIFLCSGIVGTNRHYWWTHLMDNYVPKYMIKIPDSKKLEI